MAETVFLRDRGGLYRKIKGKTVLLFSLLVLFKNHTPS